MFTFNKFFVPKANLQPNFLSLTQSVTGSLHEECKYRLKNDLDRLVSILSTSRKANSRTKKRKFSFQSTPSLVIYFHSNDFHARPTNGSKVNKSRTMGKCWKNFHFLLSLLPAVTRFARPTHSTTH